MRLIQYKIEHKKIKNKNIFLNICFLFLITILIFIFLPIKTFAKTYEFIGSLSDGTEIILNLPIDTINSIAELDLGGDGTSELVIGSHPGIPGKIWITRLNGSIINSWMPYDEKFSGGVNVVATDIDGNGKPEIITAPYGEGGPHVRIFDGFGNPKISAGFFVAGNDNRNGVSISVQKIEQEGKPKIAAITQLNDRIKYGVFSAEGKEIKTTYAPIIENSEKEENEIRIKIFKDKIPLILTIPKKAKSIEEEEKTIIINLSSQNLSYYKNGYRIATYPVSTGKPSTPTPIGVFAINNKTQRAWSKSAKLWMPYWMSFIGNLYGMHELPEWPGGIKEGASHLGIPVSGGCIRLGVGHAKILYEWAEIGTKVIIQK